MSHDATVHSDIRTAPGFDSYRRLPLYLQRQRRSLDPLALLPLIARLPPSRRLCLSRYTQSPDQGCDEPLTGECASLATWREALIASPKHPPPSATPRLLSTTTPAEGRLPARTAPQRLSLPAAQLPLARAGAASFACQPALVSDRHHNTQPASAATRSLAPA